MIKQIIVKYEKGNNWEFAVIDAGDGKKVLAVF